MKNYRISIVGGSISGLSAALVFASAIKEGTLGFEITVIDEGGNKADLFKAEPYNVPLFRPGISPEDILKSCKEQIATMAKVDYMNQKVVEINGTKGNLTVKTCNGDEIKADYVVLATGANEFDIKGIGDNLVEPHLLMNKPNKIKLKHDGNFKVKDGIYVAGLASGVTSMIASAMGAGTSSACAILSDINGAVTVIHDSKGTRK